MITIHLGDNLPLLRAMPDASFDLIYVDPPFNTGREKTGYPTQKPPGVLERIVKVHSRPGDRLLDFFAGSGTLGEAAARAGRRAVLIDSNPEAVRIMKARLALAGKLEAPGSAREA